MESLYRKSHLSLVISLLLAGGFLALAIRGVSWREMFNTVKHGRIDSLILIFLIQSLSYFVRGLRWNILLRAEKFIPFSTAFWAMMVGYLGNNFLPARAGEVIRSVMIGRNIHLSKSYALATILTERIVDVVFLVLIGLVMLLWLKSLPGWIIHAIWVMGVFSFISLVALYLIPRFEPWFKERLIRLFVPRSFRIRAGRSVEKFFLGMRVFQDSRRALSFIGLTVVIWLIDAGVTIGVARALNTTLTLMGAFILLSALGLASAVPSTPGYIGIFQFVAVTVLVPFNFTRSEALVYIITLQAVIYAVVIVWGLLGLWRLRAKALDVETVERKAIH